jgi:hypothetical protein
MPESDTATTLLARNLAEPARQCKHDNFDL